MLHRTRWSPDTCGCVLEYVWDTETPEDARVHTPVTPVVICPVHAGVANPAAHFNAVAAENRAKNLVHQRLLAEDRLALDVPGQSGRLHREFRPGVDFTWTFVGQGPVRALEVRVQGADLTPVEKTRVVANMDNVTIL